MRPSRSDQIRHTPAQSPRAAAPKPVDVREFAEADTTLGMVNVGYTDEAQLAFTFAYTNDTYLLPIVDILSELISAIVARRPIWSRPHKPAKLM